MHRPLTVRIASAPTREGNIVAKAKRPLVTRYGTLWARNRKNIQLLRAEGKLWGVYVLCNGSMPLYIGRGRLASRIGQHQHSKGQFWDHFSWYAIPDRTLEADVEALLLRMLPFYLRSLNKARTRFADAERVEQASRVADPIKLPKFAP
jgi:hypothetical protein